MKRRLGVAAALLLPLAAAAAATPNDYYFPGNPNDPRLRYAEFLAGTGRYMSAVTQLLQLQSDAAQQYLQPAYRRELADDSLAFGMPDRAELIYREPAAKPDDALGIARGRLHLAEFYNQRGHYQEATDELAAARARLPKQLLADWQDLLSRVLLAQGRYAEAADVLTRDKNGGDQAQLTRYNLGIALINAGRAGQGTNVLDRVGRMRVTSSETLALRDKANLTLAYHFLRDQEGGTAIPVFERIRTQGPYSNKALLGLGWAHLAPRGSRQKKTALGDEGDENTHKDLDAFATIGVLLRPGYVDYDNVYQRAQLTPFHLGGKAANQEAQLKMALVPWVELLNRDPMDPAVQEGMLAIPYVLDRLGAHVQAKDYYERAIPALEQTRSRLEQAMDNVRSGRMVTWLISADAQSEKGWTWKPKLLPDMPETYYLQTLLAQNAFQEGLKNYRDVRLLQQNLQQLKANLGDLQQDYRARTTREVEIPALPHVPLAAGAPSEIPPGSAQPDAQPAAVLQMADRLGGNVETGKEAKTELTVPLQLAPTPGAEHFAGAYEQMEAVRAHIDELLPKLVAAERLQARRLQDMAVDDLQKQKTLNEKYLVESRFALARIYDSQFKDEPR